MDGCHCSLCNHRRGALFSSKKQELSAVRIDFAGCTCSFATYFVAIQDFPAHRPWLESGCYALGCGCVQAVPQKQWQRGRLCGLSAQTSGHAGVWTHYRQHPAYIVIFHFPSGTFALLQGGENCTPSLDRKSVV